MASGVISYDKQKKMISMIDNINKTKLNEYRKSFNPKKSGWYRITKFGPHTYLSTARGGCGYLFKFTFKSYFNESANMTFTGILSGSHTRSNITILGESVVGQCISKLRHTIDTATNTAYLEFYYNVDNSNGLNFEIESINSFEYKWQIMNELESTLETVDGVEIYSTADLVTKDRNAILRNDLLTLFKPIEGTVITNTVPSKTYTLVNELKLNAGIYIIYAFCVYDYSFNYQCNYAIDQSSKGTLVVARNTGNGGGGQTPFCILQLDSSDTIKFILWQGDTETRYISANKLVAIKLA